jgi:uncharacterized protein (TIGR00251 family)
MAASILEESASGVLIRIKAVPGASRDQIAGLIGDRLKVRTSAPPEGGKANRAICRLLADAVGARPKDVVVAVGQTNPEKTIRIAGVTIDDVRAKLPGIS